MRILIVDGDQEASKTLLRDLNRHGYDTFYANAGRQAVTESEKADFIVLDLGLPDMDGLAVCREIRISSNVPILAISSHETELDRVLGLQAGADDCISKPYGTRELTARIEAITRRNYREKDSSQFLTHGPLEIDCRIRQVRINGKEVCLTRKEFDLLLILAAKPDSIISRKQLMAKVWEDPWAKGSRTIDTHVSSLRCKLGSSTWITTIRGVGYRLGYG